MVVSEVKSDSCIRLKPDGGSERRSNADCMAGWASAPRRPQPSTRRLSGVAAHEGGAAAAETALQSAEVLSALLATGDASAASSAVASHVVLLRVRLARSRMSLPRRVVAVACGALRHSLLGRLADRLTVSSRVLPILSSVFRCVDSYSTLFPIGAVADSLIEGCQPALLNRIVDICRRNSELLSYDLYVPFADQCWRSPRCC